ncbi:MAG TPA: glutaredoxin family protein, partial [Armatimonadota bacterium]|nr:glutaredoxin family protein [Armatimonadota bacterium]
MTFTRVDGREPAKIRLYTLSTCGWCRKAKNLLNELHLAYEYVDVDLLDEPTKAEVRAEVAGWNARCSFPTMIID